MRKLNINLFCSHISLVQQRVRVKLPEGMTWDRLSAMIPGEIRDKWGFPEGFLPLPHVKHETGGQVITPSHIKEIRKLEDRNLERFDVEFDLPYHHAVSDPEFTPAGRCPGNPPADFLRQE